MKAIQDLFSTDYGLMSIVGIALMVVGMVAAFAVLKSKMADSAKKAGKS